MKQLRHSLKVEKLKETQFTGGGNICVSSNGKFLFCILGTSVNIIDVETGTTKHSLESEEEEITCVLLSPDDKHLITAHRSLLLKQWDNWNKFENGETEPDKRKEDENKKQKWHTSTTKCTRTWKAIHTAPIQTMTFDSTSTLLATGSSDYTTKVWDIQAQYCTHNLKGAQGITRCIRFYPSIQAKQQLITGGDDGKLRVYNLNTSKLDVCLEDAHFSAITNFEYVFNNATQEYDQLVSGSRDKVIILWDLKTNAKLRTMPIYESIESFVLDSQILTSTKQKFVITMGNEGLLKLWDLSTGRSLFTQDKCESLKIVNKRNADSSELDAVITQGFYSPALGAIVMVTADQMIVLVKVDDTLMQKLADKSELKTNEYKGLFKTWKQFIGDHGEILDVKFCTADENLLAVATNNQFVKIYNLNTWDCKLLKGHDDLILSLSVYVDKDKSVSYLASSAKDSRILIWRISRQDHDDNDETKQKASPHRLNEYTFEQVYACHGHTQDVGALCFSKLGFNFLVSGSIDTTIKLWTIKIEPKKTPTNVKQDQHADADFKVAVLFTVKAHEKDINTVCVSPNDKLIASGSSDKSAKIWDSKDGSLLAVLRGHKRGIWSVEFSPVDQLVATSSADGTIKLWSLTDFGCIKTFEGHNTSVLKVFFLNHGTQLISTGSDGLLKLWNIKTNECCGTFDEHDDKAWSLALSKQENRVVSGAADGKLIVWKDVTDEIYDQELEQREDILLKEQELENFVKEKKWRKALALALLLDKPFRCYEIIREILEESDETDKGRTNLEKTLLKLREDQIKSLLKYASDWNTNTKFCYLAQTVFELVLRNYPPETFMNESDNEYATKLVEQFMPYTERHGARLNKLAQQIMFIDYCWQNMKLNTG